jgi:hypothetical protein
MQKEIKRIPRLVGMLGLGVTSLLAQTPDNKRGFETACRLKEC